jgi:hypothetical protein
MEPSSAEAGKIANPRVIAMRMARAFLETETFVFDRRLVDHDVVKRLITLAGIDSYLSSITKDSLVVYTVKRSLIEARCRQVTCRRV